MPFSPILHFFLKHLPLWQFTCARSRVNNENRCWKCNSQSAILGIKIQLKASCETLNGSSSVAGKTGTSSTLVHGTRSSSLVHGKESKIEEVQMLNLQHFSSFQCPHNMTVMHLDLLLEKLHFFLLIHK